MDLLTGHQFTVTSYGPGAAYTAWLLREYGAEVAHRTALDPERLGAFFGQGATFAAEPGMPSGAGVCVTDAPVTAANRAQLEALAANSPVIWITPWPLDSEWAERPWTDLTLQAAGGWMSAVGDPGEEPLGPPGAQASFTAGLYGAIAALRHIVTGEAPAAGLVNVPVVEAVLATTIYDAVGYQYLGNVRQRVGRRFGIAQPTLVTLPCKDGYVGIHAALHAQWLRLCQATGYDELVADARFADLLSRIGNVAELDTYWERWLEPKTRWETYHCLQAAGIPSAGLPTLQEVLDSPQLNARSYFRKVTTPSGRELKVPGSPARIVSDGANAAPPSRGAWREGALRVVDFSMGWAGPMVTFILSSFGADVVKVESHTRFDWWRGSRPPGDDPSLALHERSHVFNATNRGKRGITIDLTTPAGRELALDLCSTADMVVENYGSSVMEKFGLGWEALKERNPRLVMLRQPGFGATGPEAGYRVFGNTIEGMSGLTQLIGYEGGPPYMMSNAFGDPISGLNGVVAALAGVARQRAENVGVCIEAAQLEGFIPLISEELIDYQRSGQQPPRRGNRREGHEPSGLFRAAGEDRWVAIDVATDEQWASLAELLGDPAVRGGEFATTAGRAACRERVHEVVSQWLGGQDRDAAVERLLAAGIPAAPMQNEPDVLANELFAGFWLGTEREPVGFHLYPAVPIIRDGEHAGTDAPAPHLGEHNDEVFAGLGLGPTDIASLEAAGTIGRLPA